MHMHGNALHRARQICNALHRARQICNPLHILQTGGQHNTRDGFGFKDERIDRVRELQQVRHYFFHTRTKGMDY